LTEGSSPLDPSCENSDVGSSACSFLGSLACPNVGVSQHQKFELSTGGSVHDGASQLSTKVALELGTLFMSSAGCRRGSTGCDSHVCACGSIGENDEDDEHTGEHADEDEDVLAQSIDWRKVVLGPL